MKRVCVLILALCSFAFAQTPTLTQTCDQLDTLVHAWYGEEAKSYEVWAEKAHRHQVTYAAALAGRDVDSAALASKYLPQVRPLLTQADSWRQQFIKQTNVTDEDANQAALFGKVLGGGAAAPYDLLPAGRYMRRLQNRVTAP